MKFSFKKFLKTIKKLLLILLVAALLFAGYLFIGKAPEPEKITWGVNFSKQHAQNLGLDWKKTYLALLDDLGAKNMKIAADWDLLEPQKDKYQFEDLDWQIKESEKRNANIILIIGMKTSRWPECHIPDWAKSLDKENQQKKILEIIEKIVSRYNKDKGITIWQVENEPFFPFGECPWVDKGFLKKEVSLVKSLDNNQRLVLLSDSGEGSFWFQAAYSGDIVGTTMYRKVWFSLPYFLKKKFNWYGDYYGVYVQYPLPPVFYWRKAEIINKIFGKKVISIELQAEPWGPKLLYDLPIKEQEKTMNPEQFISNIEYAKKTGLKEFYLWGGEWWYWMKEKQNKPEIWEEAKKLFKEN